MEVPETYFAAANCAGAVGGGGAGLDEVRASTRADHGSVWVRAEGPSGAFLYRF